MLYPVFCSKTIRKSASFLHTKHFNATKITWHHAKHFNATRGICSLRFCQTSYYITSKLCVVLYLYVIASQLHGLPRSGHPTIVYIYFTIVCDYFTIVCAYFAIVCVLVPSPFISIFSSIRLGIFLNLRMKKSLFLAIISLSISFLFSSLKIPRCISFGQT